MTQQPQETLSKNHMYTNAARIPTNDLPSLVSKDNNLALVQVQGMTFSPAGITSATSWVAPSHILRTLSQLHNGHKQLGSQLEAPHMLSPTQAMNIAPSQAYAEWLINYWLRSQAAA